MKKEDLVVFLWITMMMMFAEHAQANANKGVLPVHRMLSEHKVDFIKLPVRIPLYLASSDKLPMVITCPDSYTYVLVSGITLEVKKTHDFLPAYTLFEGIDDKASIECEETVGIGANGGGDCTIDLDDVNQSLAPDYFFKMDILFECYVNKEVAIKLQHVYTVVSKTEDIFLRCTGDEDIISILYIKHDGVALFNLTQHFTQTCFEQVLYGKTNQENNDNEIGKPNCCGWERNGITGEITVYYQCIPSPHTSNVIMDDEIVDHVHINSNQFVTNDTLTRSLMVD